MLFISSIHLVPREVRIRSSGVLSILDSSGVMLQESSALTRTSAGATTAAHTATVQSFGTAAVLRSRVRGG